MNSPASPLSGEIESLKAAYAAINRNDVAGFVKCFDAQVVRIEPSDFPRAGTYHGREAVQAHVATGRGTWAEGTCEPTRYIAAADRVVVLAHVHVRLHGSDDWIDGDMADVFTFRDGKVIEYRSFGEPGDALAYAGVEVG